MKDATLPKTRAPKGEIADSGFVRTMVFPGENAMDFEALEAAHLEELAPRTPYERSLAQDLISYEWEIYRYRRLRDAAVLGRYREFALGLLTTGAPRELLSRESPAEEDLEHARDLVSADGETRAAAEKDLVELTGRSVDELLALAAQNSTARAHNERIADLEHRRRALRKDYSRLRAIADEPIEDAVLLEAQ